MDAPTDNRPIVVRAAAAGIRAQVVQLAKLGMLTDAKYAELFPSSSYIAHAKTPTFGEYAQDWLDSREVVAGTRRNYLWALNQYWMPELATKYLDEITMRCGMVFSGADRC